MPEICCFYGITIRMYFREPAPPHYHAEYAGSEASIGIDNLSVTRGHVPTRAHRLVVEWASLHQDELRAAWDRAQLFESPGRMAPLEQLGGWTFLTVFEHADHDY